MTLSDSTSPGQSGRGNYGNEGVHRIPQSSCITGTSASDCLVSQLDTQWGSLTFLHILQSVCFTAPADRAILIWYEKLQIPSCTTCLIRNSDIPISLAIDLIDFLGWWTISARISPIKPGVVFLVTKISEASQLPASIITSGHIQLFSKLLRDKHFRVLILELEVNIKEYIMSFPNLWRCKLCHGAVFLTDRA